MGATSNALEVVYVTVAGQDSNHTTFTWTAPVVPGPTITSISPNPISQAQVTAGQLVTITGQNFGAGGTGYQVTVPNGITVSSAGAQCWNTSSCSNQITFNISSAAVSGNMTVTTPAGTSPGVAFNVSTGVAGPTVFNISPTTGPVGTAVTINGANFGTLAGSVTFGGQAAQSITCWDITPTCPNQIIATASGSGVVQVTVNGSQSVCTATPPNTCSFSVPPPVVSSNAPVSIIWPEIIGTDFPSNCTGAGACVTNPGGSIVLNVKPGQWQCNSPCVPPITQFAYLWHTVNGSVLGSGIGQTSITLAPSVITSMAAAAPADGAIEVDETAMDSAGHTATRSSHWFGPIELTAPAKPCEAESGINCTVGVQGFYQAGTPLRQFPHEPMWWNQNGHAVFNGCDIPPPAPVNTKTSGDPNHVWYFDPLHGHTFSSNATGHLGDPFLNLISLFNQEVITPASVVLNTPANNQHTISGNNFGSVKGSVWVAGSAVASSYITTWTPTQIIISNWGTPTATPGTNITVGIPKLFGNVIHAGDTVYVDPGWSQVGGPNPVGDLNTSGTNYSTSDGTTTGANLFTWILPDPDAATRPVLTRINLGSSAAGFVVRGFGVERYRDGAAVTVSGGTGTSGQTHDIYLEDISETAWLGHSLDPIYPLSQNSHWPHETPGSGAPGIGTSDGTILTASGLLCPQCQDFPSLGVSGGPGLNLTLYANQLPLVGNYIWSPRYFEGYPTLSTSNGIPNGTMIKGINGVMTVPYCCQDGNSAINLYALPSSTAASVGNTTYSGSPATVNSMSITEMLTQTGYSNLIGHPFTGTAIATTSTASPQSSSAYLFTNITVRSITTTGSTTTMQADNGAATPGNVTLYDGMAIRSSVAGFPISVIVHTLSGTNSAASQSAQSFTVTASSDYSGAAAAATASADGDGTTYAIAGTTTANQTVYIWDSRVITDGGLNGWVSLGTVLPVSANLMDTFALVINPTQTISVDTITGGPTTYTMHTTTPVLLTQGTRFYAATTGTNLNWPNANISPGTINTTDYGQTFSVTAGGTWTMPANGVNGCSTLSGCPASVTTTRVFTGVTPNPRAAHWRGTSLGWEDKGTPVANLGPCVAGVDPNCPTGNFVDPRSHLTLTDPAGHSNIPGCDPYISIMVNSIRQWQGGCEGTPGYTGQPLPWSGATRTFGPIGDNRTLVLADGTSVQYELSFLNNNLMIVPAGYWNLTDNDAANASPLTISGGRSANPNDPNGMSNLFGGVKCIGVKDGAFRHSGNANANVVQIENSILYNNLFKWTIGDNIDIYSDNRVWLVHNFSSDTVSAMVHPDQIQFAISAGAGVDSKLSVFFGNAVIEDEHFQAADPTNWIPHGSQGIGTTDAQWPNMYMCCNWVSVSYINAFGSNGTWQVSVNNSVIGGNAGNGNQGRGYVPAQPDRILGMNNFGQQVGVSAPCTAIYGGNMAIPYPPNPPGTNAGGVGGSYACTSASGSAGGIANAGYYWLGNPTGGTVNWTSAVTQVSNSVTYTGSNADWTTGGVVPPPSTALFNSYYRVTTPAAIPPNGWAMDQRHSCIQGNQAIVGECDPTQIGTFDLGLNTGYKGFVGDVPAGNNITLNGTVSYPYGGGGAGGARLPGTGWGTGTSTVPPNIGDRYYASSSNLSSAAGGVTGYGTVTMSKGVWLYNPGSDGVGVDPISGVSPAICSTAVFPTPPCVVWTAATPTVPALAGWVFLGTAYTPGLIGNGQPLDSIQTPSIKPIADHFGHPWKNPPSVGSVEVYP
jgi:hypothetical protein